MLTFYFLCLIIIILLIIGGFDATMRLVSYLDLQVTYQIIRIRSYFFMIKVRRNLLIDRETLLKDLEKTMPNKELSDLSIERKECPKCGATWINGNHVWNTGKPGNELDLAGLVCNNLGDNTCINPLKGSEGGDTWNDRYEMISKFKEEDGGL